MFVATLDERAHFLGRLNWYSKAPAMLGVHLRMTQILHDHPEILEEKIEKPIIIAAYVRSGSTWLQHILADTYGKSLRPVAFWESLGGGIDHDPQKPGSAKWTAWQ